MQGVDRLAGAGTEAGRRTSDRARTSKKLGLAVWATEPLANIVAQVKLAEDIGFDSVWVIDSQLLCRDVFVTLAALAVNTSRIKLATGVTQPATRHPAVTASALAALDELSGGRIMSGMGTGFSSLRTLGLPAAKMAEFEAFVAAVRQLLAQETARFPNGFEARMTWLAQPARVPIFGAASGPKMTQLVARIADGAILLQGIADDLLDRAHQWLDEGAASAGRDLSALEVACWVPLGLDDDPERARDQVRVRVAGAIMNTNADWFEGAEREAVLAVQGSYKDFQHAGANADHASILPDRIVDRYAIAGTPEGVREGLARVMRRPDLDHVILTPQASADDKTDVLGLLRRFDRDILAKL
jgi:5,10-methylenetetrahydromethanopterin reductase